jgi:hypothetical protein
MRKILLATALLGSLMVPLAGTADAAKVIIAPGIGGWVGPGPYVGPGYVGPGYGGGYVAPGFGIGWVGPGYYYNPGYYDRYYHPRYGYCRSTWYRGVRVCRWHKRRWW